MEQISGDRFREKKNVEEELKLECQKQCVIILNGQRIDKVVTRNLFLLQCVALYWVTSSVCGLLQNLVLMHPGLHKVLRLPPISFQHQEPYRHLWFQLLKKAARKKDAQE